MRINILAICIFLLVFQVHARAVYGQEQVTLKEKNASLVKVLDDIRKKTGLNYAGQDATINSGKAITFDVKNMALPDLLDLIFKEQPYTYALIDRTIVIKKRDVDPPIENHTIPSLHGRVVDSTGSPLMGATITVEGSNKIITSNEDGEFTIKDAPDDATLIVSFVGYATKRIPIQGRNEMTIYMRVTNLELAQVSVEVNTGYQRLPKERATGSFDQLNNDVFNRRISPDIMTKLDGVTSGVLFNGTPGILSESYFLPNTSIDPNEKLGINIRGQSTLYNLVSKDPLIIVDGFPYEGDINNLDPEMIESVTVLKDAAAASIWGARSGNGVIVFTTKNGQKNQKLKIDFSANFTIAKKPNLFYNKNFLDANDYINVEDTLFNYGYLSYDLVGNSNFPVVTPVATILQAESLGQLTPQQAATQINAYRGLDVRKDYAKYIYRSAASQQYSVTMRGGGPSIAYSLSAGYDGVGSDMYRNDYKRFVINSSTVYTPVKNLDITVGLLYSQINKQSDNGFVSNQLSLGGDIYGTMYPYAQFADAKGNHLPIAYGYSNYYIDSVQNMGFEDWSYRPLDELALASNNTKQTDLVLKGGLRYKFTNFLNVDLKVENETQHTDQTVYYDPNSYYVRNLVNTFTQVSGGTLSYPFPQGGILDLTSSPLESTTGRGQLNYDQRFKGNHRVTVILGSEIRQTKNSSVSSSMYGYNNSYGTSVSNLDFSDYFPTNPSGETTLPPAYGNYSESVDRFISYYGNAAYTFRDRYTLTGSARKDGANIFGVNINDKFVPLWSAGAAWDASKESFYHLSCLPYLKLRATYGYNGNVYNAASYLIASYSTSFQSGFPTARVTYPPNPDLRWERVRNVNLAVDFALRSNVLSGSLEWYEKQGLDLIEPYPLAPTTGFSSFQGNEASTRTKGIDLTLNSKNLDRKFKWYTTLLLSTLHDKVTKWDVAQTATTIQDGNSGTMLGRPISSIFSYKWAGLDHNTGDPLGYLGGKTSNDYQDIINNFNPDSLRFNGSATPTVYGSLRNSFEYKGFTLSCIISYKLGYYFRRASTSLNYSDILYTGGNADYSKRWQKPGDEASTSVPSLAFPANYYRNTFYQFSSVLVDRADNIRFQDIELSYDIAGTVLRKMRFSQLQVFGYVNNLGIIWKANKDGIDPNAYNYPTPVSYSFGVRASL